MKQKHLNKLRLAELKMFEDLVYNVSAPKSWDFPARKVSPGTLWPELIWIGTQIPSYLHLLLELTTVWPNRPVSNLHHNYTV